MTEKEKMNDIMKHPISIHEACKIGEIDVISRVLESTPEFVNLPDKNGSLPLQIASKHQQVNVVKYLLLT